MHKFLKATTIASLLVATAMAETTVKSASGDAVIAKPVKVTDV